MIIFVDIFEFRSNSKSMTDKTQTHSFQFDSDQFMKLWQDKWAEMLKEKGWPETMAMPQMGQMPFMMPFMPNFGGFGAAPDNTALHNKIAELEQRIATLEKKQTPKPKMTQRNKAPAKKTKPKGLK